MLHVGTIFIITITQATEPKSRRNLALAVYRAYPFHLVFVPSHIHFCTIVNFTWDMPTFLQPVKYIYTCSL